MLDIEETFKDDIAHQALQAAARESGHVLTIRVTRMAPGCGPNLRIESNFPALLLFDDTTDELGYTLRGGMVHSLTGSCPCHMTPIADLAKDGITEVRIPGDNGMDLVIPIGPWSPPEA